MVDQSGMTDLATHTRPEERPEWQRTTCATHPCGDGVLVATVNGMPVYAWHGQRVTVRVPCRSRPHPWPESKLASEWTIKRFMEVK